MKNQFLSFFRQKKLKYQFYDHLIFLFELVCRPSLTKAGRNGCEKRNEDDDEEDDYPNSK